MFCTSCKSSYNVLNHLGTGSNCAYQGWGGGGRGRDMTGQDGVMPKRESPDFWFPEVGSSVIGLLKCCYSFSDKFNVQSDSICAKVFP